MVAAAEANRATTNSERKEEARDKKKNKKAVTVSGQTQTETEAEVEGGWANVVGRKAKRSGPPVTDENGKEQATTRRTEQGEKKKSVLPARPTLEPKKTPKLAKTPPRAAVALTLEEPSEKGYAEFMAAAKNRVDLKEIGIDSVVVKRALTGGLLLEISGPEKEERAAILAAMDSVTPERDS